MSCALTPCSSTVFSLLTTSRKLCGPLLTLRGEPQGCGCPAGRTPADHQAPGVEGVQTMTDGAPVTWHGVHQVLRTTREHASGALVVRRSPLEETLLSSGEASCGHHGPL